MCPVWWLASDFPPSLWRAGIPNQSINSLTINTADLLADFIIQDKYVVRSVSAACQPQESTAKVFQAAKGTKCSL